MAIREKRNEETQILSAIHLLPQAWDRAATRYSKRLHIEPQQDLKMAKKCIEIFLSVRTYACEKQPTPKPLLTCRRFT